MANWTSSTLLSRTLELVDAETAISAEDVLKDPKAIDSHFPTGSSLIEFLKEQVIKEAMRGPAHVSRPTKKKAVKKPEARLRPDKSIIEEPATGTEDIEG